MNRNRFRIELTVLVVLSALLSFGCPRAGRTANTAIEPGLALTLTPADGGRFAWGKVTPAAFTVRNAGRNPLLVLEIIPDGDGGEEPIPLWGQAYGDVERLASGEGYRYGSLPQQMTALPFFGGLLLPGQTVTLVVPFRPVARVERFTLSYLAGTAARTDAGNGRPPAFALDAIFLPEGDPGAAGEMLYQPFRAERWRAICARHPETGLVGPGVPPRAILLATPPAPSERAEFQVPVDYPETPLVLEEARSAAARLCRRPAADIHPAFSAALGGYVVAAPGGAFLLEPGPSGTQGRRLPPLPPGMLKQLDQTGSVRVRVGNRQEGFGPEPRPAGRLLWDRFPVAYGDGMYTRGEFVTITRTELADFLDRVLADGGTLNATRYFFRERYFTLTGGKEGER